MNDLMTWLATFCRKRRTEPKKFVLDEIEDADFCLVFDCEDDPETPEAAGTCDILIEMLPHCAPAGDYLASRFRIVANCNRFGVMRFIAAMGIRRFKDKTKAAFYEMSNPLRAEA